MTGAVSTVPTARVDRTGIIALIVAESLSTVGTRISFVAIPWLVLVTTHDPIKMGIVSGASTLPYVLNGFIASPLVDRIGSRRMSNISDVVSALLMGLVALTYHYGIVVMAILVAICGSFRGIGDRAKNTMLKPLIDASNADTMRITSAYTGAVQLALLGGGSVAGLLIALFNPWGAIWIDAASFLVCAVLITGFVVMPKPPEPEAPALTGGDGLYKSASAPAKPEPYLAQLGASFTFLRGQKLISAMVGMLFVTNLFGQVGMVTFIPLWIDTHLDHSPIALGWISAAYALGGIAGNTVFTALATKLPRYKTFVAGYFLGGPPRFLVLAFSHNLIVVAAVWAFCGFALSSSNPTIGAVMYKQVPGNMLARVGSLASAISFAGLAVGGVVGGWSVENLGFTNAVILSTVIYFLATLSPIAGKKTWEIIDVITRPVRVAAAGARVSIRLVLTEHHWSATAKGRDGAAFLEEHPVDGGTVAHALGLINPPELRPALGGMLTREQIELQKRSEELRAQLAEAEARLSHITETARGYPQLPAPRLSLPVTYRSAVASSAAYSGGPGPSADDDVTPEPAAAEPAATESAAAESAAPESVSPERSAPERAPVAANGHHGSLGATTVYPLTTSQPDGDQGAQGDH